MRSSGSSPFALGSLIATTGTKSISYPLNTYYLSYHCKPLPAHPNTGRYTGMVADLFVTAESEEGVEGRIKIRLNSEGWAPEELVHAELVETPATHDSRLSLLFQQAQKEGFASLLSPY